MGTIQEEHMKWVQKLKDRGEVVLQPQSGKPFGSVSGYIKTQTPHKDAGAMFQDKDGTFGLFGDMGALHVTGLDWDDLGLCDSKCWYEWMSPETYQPEKGEEEVEVDGLSSEVRAALAVEQDRSLKLSGELDKQLKALIELRNMIGLRARAIYLEEDVVTSLHNEGLEPGNWALFVNRALREALQTLADKQER